MAKMLVLLALCVLSALVNVRATYMGESFQLYGRVYCDTCCAGFETELTTGIAGARVRVECKDKISLKLKYSIEAVTDSTGAYEITVTSDRGDDICDVVLVSSPQTDCDKADPGRDSTRVILTRDNGVISNKRYANAMGFLRNQPMSGCDKVLQKYIVTDDQ